MSLENLFGSLFWYVSALRGRRGQLDVYQFVRGLSNKDYHVGQSQICRKKNIVSAYRISRKAEVKCPSLQHALAIFLHPL